MIGMVVVVGIGVGYVVVLGEVVVGRFVGVVLVFVVVVGVFCVLMRGVGVGG